MLIPVLDFTTNWGSVLPEVVARWDAALAFRGIRLTYEKREPSEATRVPDAIGVYNAPPPPPMVANALGQGGYEAPFGEWLDGYVYLFMDPNRSPTLAMACAVHELGHALMLNHQTDQPSVMTPIPRLAYPSTWDAMNAMPGFPWPETSPPAPSPPAPEHHKDKKKRRKKHR